MKIQQHGKSLGKPASAGFVESVPPILKKYEIN
jgi:hypothetical protein